MASTSIQYEYQRKCRARSFASMHSFCVLGEREKLNYFPKDVDIMNR